MHSLSQYYIFCIYRLDYRQSSPHLLTKELYDPHAIRCLEWLPVTDHKIGNEILHLVVSETFASLKFDGLSV